MIKYKVRLSKEEREQLTYYCESGFSYCQATCNAYVLLNSDEGEYNQKIINEEINRVLKVCMRMIERGKLKPQFS